MSVRGLHKIIYPFAPDQSGAVSVLYELGGMIIICDAGGCAGNVCGFDEPRWLDTRSAVFSAGLRDMDAILGRDDLLIKKITGAAKRLDADFIAIIGTPVPATIATDYRALRRMAEKSTGLPVLTVNSNGIQWYDKGAAGAYMELLKKFTEDPKPEDEIIQGSVGVLEMTPLDAGITDIAGTVTAALRKQGASEVLCYGSGHSVGDISRAGRMERNIVVSPSGLKAARYLKERYGTPYTCEDPLAEDVLQRMKIDGSDLEGRKVLLIHQQIRANSIRELLKERYNAVITVATWFMADDEIREPGDIRIKGEDDFIAILQEGSYDTVIADSGLYRPAKKYCRAFYDLPHFAVSGRLEK